MDSFLPKNPSNQSFTDKQKNLFAHLEDAAKKNKLSLQAEEDMDTDFQELSQNNYCRKKPMKNYKKQESIFKRPEAPINRCLPYRRKPSFQKNPNSWTKYSLSDVRDEDMSEQGNRKAALSFLKELEQRNCKDIDEERLESLPEKIVFKKSAAIKSAEMIKDAECGNKAIFKSSKLVMPEYVIGQKVAKMKPIKKAKVSSSLGSGEGRQPKELTLNHLLDDEDEDE